jgi:hypothetical protein
LKRDLHRYFNRTRSIATKENMFQAWRCQPNQPLCKLNGYGMAHPKIGNMGHSVQLITDRLVDRRMPMPVHVTPKRTGSVKESASMNILQPASLRRLDDESIVVFHLRERVPDDGTV